MEVHCAMIDRPIDGHEKVSEWMKMNELTGCSNSDPTSPINEDHRVLLPDLLVQVIYAIFLVVWTLHESIGQLTALMAQSSNMSNTSVLRPQYILIILVKTS